jgi:septum formation protein
MRLVLASGSPRRREILEKAGFFFSVITPPFDESTVNEINPELFVKEVSRKKAESIERKSGEVVLSADTVVVLDGKIIGKPKDREDAKRMILSFSGKMHEVMTGYTIISDNFSFTDFSVTKVYVRKLMEEMVDIYLDSTDEWKDKAGAYAIQGRAGKFVEKIDGDYYNVMGLPISVICKKLQKLGLAT